MTALGLFTVFEWDAMLPDRRDVAVLRPFPVGLATLFAAKVSALFLFWGIFTLAVDGISGVFFPVSVMQNAPGGAVLRSIGAHLAALVAANLFMFLAMIAVQGLLMTVLGPERFRRVAPYAQFALIAGILSVFFLSIGLAFGLRMDAPPSTLIRSLPAYWFLGLDQMLLGVGQPLFDALSAMILPAMLVAAAVAGIAYGLSYRRSVLDVFEAQERPATGPGRVARWAARLVNVRVLRGAGERASFAFVWLTLMRSRSHRLLVASWTAVGSRWSCRGMTGAIASVISVVAEDDRAALAGAGRAAALPDHGTTLRVHGTGGAAGQLGLPAGLQPPRNIGRRPQGRARARPGPFAAGAGVHRGLGMAHRRAMCCSAQWWDGCLWRGRWQAWSGCRSRAPTCQGRRTCQLVDDLRVGVHGVCGVLCWVDLKILQAPRRVVWFLAAAWAARIAIERYRRAAGGLPLTFDERPAPAV